MRRWSLLAAALLLLAAHARAAPTQDTLVVRADDTATSSEGLASVPPASATSEAASSLESGPASEAPPAPLKMTSMEVTSEVALRYSHTTVLAHMRNPAAVAQEATFSLILPETAFISGFVMTLAGKDYVAYVKEKEEAKQVYEQAVAQGLGAAHISAKARDSNHFTVRVNVEPQTEAVFNLTYEELLERRNGVYNHAINLNPNSVVPKLDVKVHIKEGKKISVLRVPELRTGNEIDATEEDKQNPNAKIEKSADEKEATITFSPDVAEQHRLMDIYAQKTRESRSRSHHSYRPFGEPPSETDDASETGVLGQFVVQYDVEHTTDGEIFLNDGYFVHFFSPPALTPLNKHVVFVLDTSGSMMDRKIIQLREAMTSILSELRPGDYFNIIEFASSTHVYELDEAKKEPRPSYANYYSYNERQDTTVQLVPPAQATAENIALAKVIVSRLNAGGGTNINEAMTTALQQVNRGVGWTKPRVTDSSAGAPSTAPTTAATTSTTAAVSTAAATPATPAAAVAPKDEPAPEPIIIFLTDGDPTVGEMDPKRIIKRISELNTGGKRAAIFSLAFGEDADRNFLRKLSLRNEGFMRHIYEAADSAQQLSSFYRQVSSPLLAHVKFIYPTEQVEENSLTKNKFHTLYAGGEAVVAGRIVNTDGIFTPSVEGFCGVRDDDKETKYRSVSRVPVKEETGAGWGALERLWAYLTIKQKLDEKDAAADDDSPDAAAASGDKEKQTTPEKEALRLALKYSFVTPLTSLVVVKPNATSAVDAESVDKKQPYQPASLSGFAYQNRAPALAGLPGPPSPVSYHIGSFGTSAGGGLYSGGASPQFSAYPSGRRRRGRSRTKSAPTNLLTPLFAPGVPLTLSEPVAQDAFPQQYEEADYDSLTDTRFEQGPGGAVPISVVSSLLDLQDSADIVHLSSNAKLAYATGIPSHLVYADTSGLADRSSFPQLPSSSYGLRLHSQWQPKKHAYSSPSGGGYHLDSFGGGSPGLGGYPLSTPSPISATHTPAPVILTSTATSLAGVSLADYGLEEFVWVQPLLETAADALTLEVNGTTLHLKLARTTDADQATHATLQATTECAAGAGIDERPSACTYLPHCAAAKHITLDVYRHAHCDRDGFAGVCCPEPSSPAPPASAPTPQP